MKQRIRVIGIVEAAGEVLLLKRHRPRVETGVAWELPMGKIEFGEQPEEAITRVFLTYLGVHVQEVALRDAVTVVMPGERGRENSLYIIYDIKLMEGEKLNLQGYYSAYKYAKKSEASNLRVAEATQVILGMRAAARGEETSAAGISQGSGGAEWRNNYRATANGATVYVDGCSRGNPGPAGAGYYIVDENGQELKRGGVFLGFATSRVAEYYALKEGCKQALDLGLKSVRLVSDSLMMVNQMNGVYQVKNPDLVPIYESVKKLAEGFEAHVFVHVPREQNMPADAEANKAVDQEYK